MSDLPKISTYWAVETRASELSEWHHFYGGTTESEVRKFLEINTHVKHIPDNAKRIVKVTITREEVPLWI